MLFWLRLDVELIGGTDDGGCHFRPSEVRGVLDEAQEELLSWMEGFFGHPVPLDDCRRFARRLLRDLGSGRAMARNDMMPKPGKKSTVDPMAKMTKLQSEVT